MGLLHSIPGLYLPVPSGSAVALEGFATLLRDTEGISHQRGSSFRTPSQTSEPAKIPIQAENPIQNQTCHPVDTPTCSEWSLRVLWLPQATGDRP